MVAFISVLYSQSLPSFPVLVWCLFFLSFSLSVHITIKDHSLPNMMYLATQYVSKQPVNLNCTCENMWFLTFKYILNNCFDYFLFKNSIPGMAKAFLLFFKTLKVVKSRCKRRNCVQSIKNICGGQSFVPNFDHQGFYILVTSNQHC